MPVIRHAKLLRGWSLTIGSLLLALLLVACGSGSDGAATPTAMPTPSPSPSRPPSPLPSSTPIPASGLTTYTGNGYTIDYPQDWKVSRSKEGVVTFSDPQGVVYLSINVTPNPTGALSANDLVTLALQGIKTQIKNYQRVAISATTMVDGETWSQGAATGAISFPGQSSPVPGKIVVIAANHPAHALTTKGFIIAYATAGPFFDLIDHAYFQPLLHSFTFT